MYPEPLDPRHTALIIVDLQNDFLHPDGAYARGGDTNPDAVALPERVAPLAKRLKQAGGLVAATRFTLWPDAQGEPMISSHLKALRPFLARGDFAPGSHGQANVEAIAPHVDVSVDKVAYSGFFNTQLDWVLKKAGITSVIVCGIVTNGGVASTVRDAHMRDYHILVLEDGCAAFKRATHDTAIADMASIATVTDCASIITLLG
ncbi:cysteine hydrolase [Halomonas sp. M5N1S17]|uniref:cysteine hydrolase family protein n=1 Tax=Halomonas alkalisoli TaxID=2907158 RepID=UPI001F2C76B5|nr:cysteine hydrolase [Halomonas alkalisoli]MCE9663221.1 cysteine hydrolase [Halomonas alkalisoli]